MPTAPTAITSIPTPVPQTSDPANFDTRADAVLTVLPDVVDEMNDLGDNVYDNAVEAAASAASAASASATATAAAAGAISSSGYMSTSSTSLAVGAGSKAFTTQAGKSFAASGDRVTAFSAGTPTAKMRGTATYSGTTLTITVDETEGSGTYTDWILILTGLESRTSAGKQYIPLPAAAFYSRTTNGGASSSEETSSNKVMIKGYALDASTVEYVQFLMPLPPAYNGGTVSFIPLWKHGSTTTNFKVSIGCAGRVLGDGEAIDQAMGTAQYSNDTGGTTDYLYIGPETDPITLAGTPAGGKVAVVQISRAATDATNDTLAVDLVLMGGFLVITTDAENDA